MNLVKDPWILVLIGEKSLKLSLSGVFSRAKEISDIIGNSVEKFSIFRLLLCIVQASLNGPKNEQDWASCKKRIGKESLAYLKRRKNSFNLYGKYPFLQNKFLEQPNKNHHNSFLSVFIANGNNHTLFDSQARSGKERILPDDEVAKGLLIAQVFGDCGVRWRPTDGTLWGGVKTEFYGKSSVANNILLTIIKGESLLDTLHYNLITKEWLAEAKTKFGKPIWEQIIKKQKGSIDTTTYLYNLLPISKGVLLQKDSTEISVSDGILPVEYPVYRDPMGTMVVNKEGNKIKGEKYLKIDINKAIWRDLQSILQFNNSEKIAMGAWAFRHLINSKNNKDINIIAGGFSYNKAKPKMVCEWQFNIPGYLLGDIRLKEYTSNIKIAEVAFWAINKAIKKYLGIEESKNKKKEIYESIHGAAMRNYWHNLEDSAQNMIKSLGVKNQKFPWEKEVRKHALQSFKDSCKRYMKKSYGSYAIAYNFLNTVSFEGSAKNE